MKTATALAILALGLGATSVRQEAPPKYWEETVVDGKPLDSEGPLAQGKEVYGMRCAVCHGKNGDGVSVAAPYLETKPRDFTRGVFKFRTTAPDKLPQEEDLYRSVTTGFPQYGMPSFEHLPAKERWAVVKYVKTFSKAWTTWEHGDPLAIGAAPEISQGLIEKGRKLYSGKFECAKCHGETGMGDGPSAGDMKDGWGNPVRARPFALGASYFKLGSRPRDTVRTLLVGMPGSPMTSFESNLSDPKDLEELWAIAYYVQKLSEKKE